jgi:hypothetical protein
MIYNQYLNEHQEGVSPDNAPLSTSPLGDMASPATRELFVDLISTLNSTFMDYNFDNASADDFVKEPNYLIVVNNINLHLAEVYENNPCTLLNMRPLKAQITTFLPKTYAYVYIYICIYIYIYI